MIDESYVIRPQEAAPLFSALLALRSTSFDDGLLVGGESSLLLRSQSRAHSAPVTPREAVAAGPRAVTGHPAVR